jgi:hypothetical protein
MTSYPASVIRVKATIFVKVLSLMGMFLAVLTSPLYLTIAISAVVTIPMMDGVWMAIKRNAHL